MRQLPLLDSRPRSALTRSTAALALLLGAALLWAVVAELRFQRRTTEKVGQDYLTLLAHERLDAAASALRTELTGVLGPQIGGTMGSVYDQLPPPAPAAMAGNSLRCPDSPDRPPTWFRMDLRDHSVLTSPVADAATIGWLRDALGTNIQTGSLAVGTFRTLMTHDSAIVYGVKYAPFQAPVAVYGVVTCAAALADVLNGPRAHLASDSVIAVVAIAGRDTIAGHAAASARALATEDVAGIRLTAFPAFTQPLSGIVIERDAVPPAALALMLFGTVALGLIAVLQLVRERHAVRRQAELVTTISHELRTPLAQILLYSETLALDRVKGDDAKREAAEHIVDQARHLVETVSNVIGLTRSEARASGATSVVPAIESAITGVQALSDARAKVVVTVSGSPTVQIASSALRQAMTNVLDNALKFGPAAQTVTVSVERDGSVVRISVDDEGPGIPQEQRESIWTRYFRIDTQHDAAGAGIGLWLVRDIVQQAGGRAWVEDSACGGTRIVLELPAAGEP
jgi:signal transduction histidine kinase